MVRWKAKFKIRLIGNHTRNFTGKLTPNNICTLTFNEEENILVGELVKELDTSDYREAKEVLVKSMKIL